MKRVEGEGMKTNEEKLKEEYLKQRGFKKCYGYAINTLEMNPEEYEHIYFEGKSLEEAIKDFWTEEIFWSYEPSGGEQIFTDIDEAIEYAEDISDVSFEDFKGRNDETRRKD